MLDRYHIVSAADLIAAARTLDAARRQSVPPSSTLCVGAPHRLR
jgi:hypothetical protein